MMKYLAVVVMGLAGIPASQAGTIAGTVRAAPPPGAAEPAGGGAYESRRYKFAEKIDYDHLRDFVVYVDQPVTAGAPATP